MKSKYKVFVGIWLVMFVLFNALSLGIPMLANSSVVQNGAFWACYIVIAAAFFLMLVAGKYAFAADTKERTFLNFSMISVCYTGLIWMLVVGTVSLIHPLIPDWLGAILCIIMLAFTATGILKSSAAADIIEETEQNVKEKTFVMKALRVEADALVSSVTSDDMKAACKEVAEAVRFSDPMSNAQLSSLEERIQNEFRALSTAVSEKDLERVKDLSSKIVSLIKERNEKCKLLK